MIMTKYINWNWDFICLPLITVTILSQCDCKVLESRQSPSHSVVTTCGGTIEGSSGSIEYKYKEGETYNNKDRCMWTVRTSPATTEIELVKYPTEFERGYDWISVFSFDKVLGLSKTVQLGKDSDEMETVSIPGTVIILLFTSDFDMMRKGFKVEFRAKGDYQSDIKAHYDFNTQTVPGQLIYPGTGLEYQSDELSTFVISDGFGFGYSYGYNYNEDKLKLQVHSHAIECEFDLLLIYKVERDTLQEVQRICGLTSIDSPLKEVYGSDFILLFYSDNSVNYEGFDISWEYNNVNANGLHNASSKVQSKTDFGISLPTQRKYI